MRLLTKHPAKTIIFCLLSTLFILTSSYSNTDSTGRWHCSSDFSDTSHDSFTGPILDQNMNVVVVFIDFPDGRLSNGQAPTQDWQLDPAYISNLDATFNMGYTSGDGSTFNRKARKLTYQQLWNIYFSEGTYVTDEAHPDWMSHGRFGLPPTGDTARAYGSLKDYYKEVSNNNLILVPGQTGVNRTGIVNNIVTDAFGTSYVEPVTLDLPKLSGYHVPDNSSSVEITGLGNMITDARTKLQALYNSGEIQFNLSTYNGKIIFVFAGGTKWIGGLVPAFGDNNCIIREKYSANAFLSAQDPLLKYSVINGVAIVCHEFGHMLGWGHTAHGNYDIMNGNGKENQNCPSHPNIIYKLQAGWIDNSKIRKVRTISEVQNLSPVEAGGDCAVITVYGKPGYDDNWQHSEYYVIENRRMYEREDLSVKFDKKLVWRRDLVPPTPNGFNGGCLITHYVNYNPVGNDRIPVKIVNALSTRNWNLIYDPGDSRDFFGVRDRKSVV